MAVTSKIAIGGHKSYFEIYTGNSGVFDEEKKNFRCKDSFEILVDTYT